VKTFATIVAILALAFAAAESAQARRGDNMRSYEPKSVAQKAKQPANKTKTRPVKQP